VQSLLVVEAEVCPQPPLQLRHRLVPPQVHVLVLHAPPKAFDRLDEAFKLPAKIWDGLPQYKEASFAVFQLKKGEKKVHPMAFEFPRRDPKTLFFPTVHIHDGTVHEKEKFDHVLYAQFESAPMAWQESQQLAGQILSKPNDLHGIIDPKGHVYRRKMSGLLKNGDVYV